MEALGSPLTRTVPSTISRSPGSTSRLSPAIASAFSLTFRAARCTALPLITAPREPQVPTEYAIFRVSPVVTCTWSMGTPSSSATIWANTVAWAWPCVVSPVKTLTRPEVSTSM